VRGRNNLPTEQEQIQRTYPHSIRIYDLQVMSFSGSKTSFIIQNIINHIAMEALGLDLANFGFFFFNERELEEKKIDKMVMPMLQQAIRGNQSGFSISKSDFL
jgi:hypothetical protein